MRANCIPLRAFLHGGIRNKARGELRRGLPTGMVWGQAEGKVRRHPDESVVNELRAVFTRVSEFGTGRRVWLRFRAENLLFRLQHNYSAPAEIRWVAPAYIAVYNVATNPVDAGTILLWQNATGTLCR